MKQEQALEILETCIRGRLYRIIASPTVHDDKHPLLQTWRCEGINRRGGWVKRAFSYTKKQAIIATIKQLHAKG